MKTKSNLTFLKSISIVLLFTCSLLFSEISIGQQVDRWHDQSDELPGTGSDSGWIIAGVALAGIAVASWLIFFNGSDNKNKPKSIKTSEQKKKIVNDSTSKTNSDTTSLKKNDSDKSKPKK